MSVSSFSVRNCRSFQSEATVEVRPLTLLFGHNNSGKSTLLRTLPLLSESARAENSDDVLAYRGDVARHASFREIVSRLPGTPADVGFSLTWDDGPTDLRGVSFSFRQMENLGRLAVPVAERIRTFDASGSQRLDLLWAEEQAAGEAQLYRHGTGGDAFPVAMKGLVPIAKNTAGAPLSGLEERLTRLANGVSWLGAVRIPPERSLRGDKLRRPRRVWNQGAEALALLVFDKQDQGPVLPAVSRWYEDHFSRRLDIRETAGDFSALFSPLAAPTADINLADCGEGITQVLPVLVLCALAQAGRLGAEHVIALEQPELHLHTDAQCALARHLCEIAARPDSPRFLIETHSEIFLLQLQLEVLKRRLPSEHALLYNVWMAKEGQSLVKRITLDQFGRPEGMPRLFGEGLDLARDIARLRYEGGA